MCGIAGYFNRSGKHISDTSTVLSMLQKQKHRGPDDSGVRTFSIRSKTSREFSNEKTEQVEESYEGIVGFNRLSILDLSANGHQPMCSADGQVILAFNGEIYNAFDFKSGLQKDGFTFKSMSDTEVVLNLYLRDGFDEMVKKLNGMFAIVLIDLRKQELYIARDRFGIKPMYIFEAGGLVAFSSEIKSFLALPEFKARLNSTLVDEYLLFRNTINRTLYEGVQGVEPGTYLVYTPTESYVKKFFSINEYHRSPSTDSALVMEDLRSSLLGSVQRQLLSDVKLGCQLSGGIDSSLVTYFTREIKQDDLLETISITFDNVHFNEEPYVDQVVNLLGLKAHKFKLDPSYYLQHFEHTTRHFEAPLNHPNTIGIYLLSQEAKKYVTVLLSGEGADEVFGGYDRFAAVTHPYQPETLFRSLRKNKGSLWKHLLAYPGGDYRAIMGSSFMALEQAAVLKPGFDLESALSARRTTYAALSGSAFDKQVKYEISTYLPDLLMRQDKMSMAHSIENRVPFLDNDLVADSFKIPQDQLVRKTAKGEQTKFALKELSGKVFGENFSYRPKGGFGIPLKDFFSDPRFKEYLNDKIMPSIKQRGIFNAKVINHWVSAPGGISPQEVEALWVMVAFEAWALEYSM
ncbi:asparagine synthase (glutamine-hydrolyzing) [uncultured Imperialibacter sp.]|uniref:asparagine synthase (glutamine-hydrolyzing) n=1 Tax=uncultured Imperialibacter sp. TaxID=1672639 RepID=UPI0030DB4406